MATATRKLMHPTSIDLSEDTRETVNGLLQQTVSDLMDLYSHFKQAHWNLKGPNFIALHELFDTIGAEMLGHLDEIGERMVQLGGQVQGTLRHTAGESQLPEYPLDATSESEHLKHLVDSLATLAKAVRASIDQADQAGDADTADIYTALSRDLDKRLWFLEAHLQG